MNASLDGIVVGHGGERVEVDEGVVLVEPFLLFELRRLSQRSSRMNSSHVYRVQLHIYIP